MTDAKIRLSQKEMELINNADWILTKNNILKKMDLFLSGLQVKQKVYLGNLEGYLPDELLQSSPKISKGENYNGLPYRLLDYPKVFQQADIFAIRTMFWWGNFFSVTLHLSGHYKSACEQRLIEAYGLLKESGIYCCIREEQWEHHFEPSNYIPVAAVSATAFKKIVLEKSFCKLAYKVPIAALAATEKTLFRHFREITDLLSD